MKAARKPARAVFRKRPKKLAKRLTKAVRRDLAPVDDGDADPADEDRKSDLPQ